jgi:hypothetical protein
MPDRIRRFSNPRGRMYLALISALEAGQRSQMGGETRLPDGDTIQWSKPSTDVTRNIMAGVLAGNPESADLGMQMRLDNFNRKDELDAEIEKQKALLPLELETARQKWDIDSRITPYPRRFSRFWPTASVAQQLLALRTSQNGGSNRRSRASRSGGFKGQCTVFNRFIFDRGGTFQAEPPRRYTCHSCRLVSLERLP